ncbi:uncharacterized protein NDAI_0A08120 [Naumovozyma dairenensis CBS 421]|uniref:Uncharacterized protein n=1 Tax=Naumovozyma dairenensis (strain ATCC 10597 / BCRC 20456 / CBS 421 / NBRC 0211 / NRRL Y-12639) TaxID=1071378 RepID=G0W578_NAUDC|nr:hypothetical protein NDAI_0A08120 [Naumovozyma dairenensis CBS 421]CCD22966.1 hypothetical protein NDAI_0A08120 [Naumovozyma dairenensis CBS 421]
MHYLVFFITLSQVFQWVTFGLALPLNSSFASPVNDITIVSNMTVVDDILYAQLHRKILRVDLSPNLTQTQKEMLKTLLSITGGHNFLKGDTMTEVVAKIINEAEKNVVRASRKFSEGWNLPMGALTLLANSTELMNEVIKVQRAFTYSPKLRKDGFKNFLKHKLLFGPILKRVHDDVMTNLKYNRWKLFYARKEYGIFRSETRVFKKTFRGLIWIESIFQELSPLVDKLVEKGIIPELTELNQKDYDRLSLLGRMPTEEEKEILAESLGNIVGQSEVEGKIHASADEREVFFWILYGITIAWTFFWFSLKCASLQGCVTVVVFLTVFHFLVLLIVTDTAATTLAAFEEAGVLY